MKIQRLFLFFAMVLVAKTASSQIDTCINVDSHMHGDTIEAMVDTVKVFSGACPYNRMWRINNSLVPGGPDTVHVIDSGITKVDFYCDDGEPTVWKTIYIGLTHPISTGLSQVSKEPFTTYPNPVVNYLNISIDDDFQVKVLTLLGQVLLSETNTKVLDVSSLTPGVYILSITANGVTTNKKFIKT